MDDEGEYGEGDSIDSQLNKLWLHPVHKTYALDIQADTVINAGHNCPRPLNSWPTS